MKVKMLKTKAGSPDGIEVRTYQEGEVYDLPLSLSDVFIREKWGVLAEAGPVEDKMIAPTRKKRGRPKRG